MPARRTLICLVVAIFALVSSASAAATTITAIEGREFKGQVVEVTGLQCDQASEGKATITWGDGHVSQGTVVFLANRTLTVSAGIVQGNAGHTYAKAGKYNGTVSGTYSCQGDAAEFTGAAFVANVEPLSTISATEGKPFKGQVAEAKVPCDVISHEQATIAWGDGKSSEATVTLTPPDHLMVSGSHTYTAAGTYSATVEGTYQCSQISRQFSAGFTAHVAAVSQEPPPTGTTPTQTTPPPTQTQPPPPPSAKATFTLASITPGHAVLDASASAPAGTNVASYSWSVGGSSQPDAVCEGSQPQLTVMSRAAMDTTIALTAVDTQGAATTTQQTINIPAPLLIASKSAHAAAVVSHGAPSSTHKVVGSAVTPSFTVVAECAGKTKTTIPPLAFKGVLPAGAGITAGGAPPPECNKNVEFGAADVQGCLEPINEPSELPGGITAALAALLCGSHDESFCIAPLKAAADAGANFVSNELGEATASRAGATEAAVIKQGAMRAVTEALTKMGFPSYYSWDPVRINGLDIDPHNGQPILVIPSASVVVSADASIYLHGFQISPIHTVALYLPSSGGSLGEISLPHKIPIIGTLPFTGDISIALQRAHTKLSNGDTCAFDCAAIRVSAELPGVFSDKNGKGLSAIGVITADDQEGLELDSLEVTVPYAEIAGIGVEKVDFRYRRGDDSLRGEATLNLLASGVVTAKFAFVHGDFQEGHVAWDAGDGTGIDLGGPIPIFLTRLGGGITVDPSVLSAEGAIAGGGHVFGCSLFGISGTLTIQFAPFELNANAAGELLCNHVAEEYFHVDEAGDIGLGGNVHIEIYVISFEAGIAFEVSQGHFQFDGNVSACLKLLYEPCLGAEVVVSDHGVGVCADLGFTHAGAGIVFPDETHFMLDSCNIAQFRSLPMPANLASLRHFPTAHGPTASSAQTLPGFTVPHGQSVAALGVVGTGGAPSVTLHGPDGRTITTPANGYLKDANEVVIADGRKTMETYFFINHPAPGKWTITSDPGSATVSAVQQSAALPSPNLHAKVTRAHGGRERLRYSLRRIPGQQVTFVEREKGHGFRELGSAHGSHGTILFTPSSTLGQRREIIAWVSQGGQPREDVTLAHYTAPPPPPLPAPRGLTVKRHGATVTVRWHPTSGAHGYTLTVRVANGATQYYASGAPPHGTPSVTLSAPDYLGLRVSVAAQAQGKTHRLGHSATAKLRPGPQPRGVAVKPLTS
jgi:hypothetical protein